MTVYWMFHCSVPQKIFTLYLLYLDNRFNFYNMLLCAFVFSFLFFHDCVIELSFCKGPLRSFEKSDLGNPLFAGSS